MKNQTTILTILGLTAMILVVTGCPRHHRPHAPHPHRLPHPRLPFDSMVQPERPAGVMVMSLPTARPTGNRSARCSNDLSASKADMPACA